MIERSFHNISEDVDGETIDQTPISSDVMKPFGTIVMGLTHDGKMVDSLGESSSQHRKAVEDEEKNADSSADHESIVSNVIRQYFHTICSLQTI